MKNLQLKIVPTAGGHAGSSRLCNSCTHGLALTGEGMSFTWCGYMQEYVPVHVEQCNRYDSGTARRSAGDSDLELLSRYTLD